MKWIAAAIVVVLTIATPATATGHHKETHYRGWQAPDNWCREHVHPAHFSHCIKAQRVIYTVFPRRYRHDAMEVAYCESRTYRWAHNTSTDVRGLFQIDSGNIGRPGVGAKLFNSWVNAKAALAISRGGRDWSEWAGVCRPY